MQNTDLTECDTFANKVEIYLNVLHPLMLDRIGGEIDCTDIVAEDNGRMLKRTMEFRQELSKPTGLGDGIGDGAVLCFDAGPGYRLLPFGRPRDNVVPRKTA